MLLRRIILHFRKQEWTAIALDFLIVVIGVFVGIQVSNWNADRALKDRETELLMALRAEIESSIVSTNSKLAAYEQVGEAGVRSLTFLEESRLCEDYCWPIVVDFFHASQWQSVRVSQPTFDEMRRDGLPRSRTIIDAVEKYHAQNESGANTMDILPAYRTLVRGLIPVAIHDSYWLHCYHLEDGLEFYVLDCPAAVPNEVSARAVAAIAMHPDIVPTLTDWTGFVRSFSDSLTDEIIAAERAIAAIDAELGTN